MKKYIDELFEAHQKKSFDQFLADELNHHLQEVERNWFILIGTEDDNWAEYRLLLEAISRSLGVSIDFIERTGGPDVVTILYNEILNLVEDCILGEIRVTEKEFKQVQYILASLGTCLNQDFLELGLFEKGELNDHLRKQLLSALNAFG
ncbi:MAG: hypothetical protein HQM13_17920 [SAR324 cluster bacterium]|nr:hypothetical protein [SAR324 cluster bacterium]